MFTNENALRTLIDTDATASESEKRAMQEILRNGVGCAAAAAEVRLLDSEKLVMTFSEAAKILGYKGPRPVYQAVRKGVLAGYYGGADGTRAKGVLVSSIRSRIAQGRSGK